MKSGPKRTILGFLDPTIALGQFAQSRGGNLRILQIWHLGSKMALLGLISPLHTPLSRAWAKYGHFHLYPAP